MKKEILPEEIEVWYIIPAIRKEFVKLLVKEMSQREAARKLGITEAAVSQYLKKKRGYGVAFDEKIEKQIGKSVKNIKKGKPVLGEIEKILKICRKRKILCRIHRRYSDMPEKCKICI